VSASKGACRRGLWRHVCRRSHGAAPRMVVRRSEAANANVRDARDRRASRERPHAQRDRNDRVSLTSSASATAPLCSTCGHTCRDRRRLGANLRRHVSGGRRCSDAGGVRANRFAGNVRVAPRNHAASAGVVDRFLTSRRSCCRVRRPGNIGAKRHCVMLVPVCGGGSTNVSRWRTREATGGSWGADRATQTIGKTEAGP
jgi:hypothetical protein